MMPHEPVTAYISVGSNINPAANIPAAMQRLLNVEGIAVTGSSTFWRTAPIGRPEQEDYRNGVWQVRTTLGPRALQDDVLHAIESDLGRVRAEDKYAARTIDLDLVLYGDVTMDEPSLHLPHPDLSRPWVAAGVLEFEPSLTPPNGTIREQPVARPTDVASLRAHQPPGDIDRSLTNRLRDMLRK